MIFDTLDKKPNLWNIAIVTGVTAVIIAAMYFIGGPGKNAVPMSILLDSYIALVLILLVRAFFRQLRYNPYSYNTIFYSGFSLFLVFVLIMFLILTANIIRQPDVYTEDQILYVLLESAGNFMLFTFPPVLILAIALCASNISLIRHEGKRFVNILGIILSALMVGGTVFLFFFNYYASGSQREVMIHDLIKNLFAAVYLYFECMVIGAFIADIIAAVSEPRPDRDFVIILGCRPFRDGRPTPLLRGRCDRAIAFYRKQKEMTGKELTFIPSGGQGSDEIISEAECMKRYLLSQGIPERLIIKEDRSKNTFENMTFSKEIIESINPDAKAAFSTTNYHVFRGGLYARRVKMRAVGMGAKTKWYFWPNAGVREFIGLLQGHRGKQALLLAGMTAFYVILTLIVYR